eukprot:SAG31_NODE_1158_length_9605_cov_2.788555_13_plen_121_part_00
MHAKDDLNCTRGYEYVSRRSATAGCAVRASLGSIHKLCFRFWLMKEAKKRNPAVITYGLPWGEPGWINSQKGAAIHWPSDKICFATRQHLTCAWCGRLLRSGHCNISGQQRAVMPAQQSA